MNQVSHWGLPLFSAACINLFLFALMASFSPTTTLTPAVSLFPLSLTLLPPALTKKTAPVATEKVSPPPKEKVVGLTKKKLAPKVLATPHPEKLAPVVDAVIPSPQFVPVEQLSTLPTFTRQVRPTYPQTERFKGREATVIAEVKLLASGDIENIIIVQSGGRAFDEAVIVALRHSQFTPGMLHGEATPTLLRIPFEFKLR